MKINRVLILVELEGGKVHQVLLSDKEKMGVLAVIEAEKGTLQLSEQPEEYYFDKIPPHR